MMTPDVHKLTIIDAALVDVADAPSAHHLENTPDAAVSRLLDGEAVWVPRTLLPAISRTLALVAQFAKARQAG